MTVSSNRLAFVSGATGFIGSAVCRRLVRDGWPVRAGLRAGEAGERDGVDYRLCGALGPESDWRPALSGVHCLVHCAALVRVGRGEAALRERYDAVNVVGTERLARQAAEAGVVRFVHLSSILASEAQAPEAGAYARSKLAGEQALRRVAQETGLELVVLRPPLVYGPGAQGSFRLLARAIRAGLPLPLPSAAARNRRSFLYLENLVDAILCCLTHPGAAGSSFALGDGQILSTADFARLIGTQLGRAAHLWPCPAALLRVAGRMSGRGAAVRSLVSSLVADNGEILRDLGWSPPFGTAEGLAATFAAERGIGG